MGRRAMRTALVALNLLYVSLGASAAVYTVGTNIMPNWMVPNGSVNYTDWASNFTLRVGDSLYFKYNSNYHNVVKVNSTSYAACDNKHYLQVWDSGDTTVVIQEPGMHYFICGAPMHCQKSQAFSILAMSAALETPPASNSTVPGTGSSATSSATVEKPLLKGIVVLCLVVLISFGLKV